MLFRMYSKKIIAFAVRVVLHKDLKVIRVNGESPLNRESLLNLFNDLLTKGVTVFFFKVFLSQFVSKEKEKVKKCTNLENECVHVKMS